MLLAVGSAWAQDTSFLSGEELAAQLRQNVVWIAADDIGEHGYGLVVGGTADTLWVVTARHVVVRTPMRGDPSPEQPSASIRARLCTGLPGEAARAEPWPAWDSRGDDIAMLRMPRPPGYQLNTRALAQGVTVGEPVWLLGSRDECRLVPTRGGVRAAEDAAHNLRIDFPGVQGGSSGAPVLSGWGIVGLLKSAEDLTATVHAIGDLQRRVQALPPPLNWELADARNIPPTDPRAAEVDIAETLNQYLLALRNVHMLLQMPRIARAQLEQFTARYNAALRRFMKVREAYDGSLARHWPQPVLPAWRTLRDDLWAVHQSFWRINPRMEDIYRNQRSTPEVQTDMAAMEPGLKRLEEEIAQFLRLLVKEPRP